ncbi:MAG TPA: ABC transporter permease [Pyrinomonadaceae bacterium]|nr:ABC transporter permease [Pyrinomonadaceae bacterium]
MGTFFQDLRYGFRMLVKRPGFTVIAVLALALGIGANTAIFSVVNAVLLRPLPYKDPQRIVAVWETNPQLGAEMRNRNEVAMGNFLDWRAQNQTFERMGALFYSNANLTGTGEPERLQSVVVTTDLFEVLGVQPALGRSFRPEEENVASPRVVVLSHGLWQRRFGSDPAVVGRNLTINGNQVTIVGVMPQGFQLQFPTSMQVEMWMPMRIDTATQADRNAHYLYVLARLKEGVSLEQSQAAMTSIAGQLQQQFPETNADKGAHVVSLHKQLVGNVQPYLYVLFAAVGFVLLIACANVANLLLARVAARHKEVAIRIALGASRWRLIRQLLTESILLAAAGGVLGLLLAYWGIDLLVALTPGDVPRLNEIGLHAPVFAWTLLVSILTGVLFGLAPALQASKPDLNESLKESGRTSAGLERSRLRSTLVVSEVALALVLLVCAGLMIKSFMRLQQVSPGFESKNLLTMNISLPRQKYPDAQKANGFYNQLFERVRAVPGVESVGGVDPLPLSGSNGTTSFVVEGGPMLALADRPEVGERSVTPAYFQTMRIPVLKGRAFTEQDRENTPRVMIVNEALARRYWPNEEVLGKRLGFEDDASKQTWWEIVGVVGNVKHERLDMEAKPEIFFPYEQSPRNFMSLVVRTTSDPSMMITGVRDQVLAIDKDQPVFDIKTMDQRLSKAVAQSRFIMLLLGLFSALALILAAVGIYGVMAYVVSQRTHEIGIRMALGAQSRDVLRMVVRQGMTLTFIGVAIGLVAAFALTRLMSSLLYGVTATDPLTFITVALVLSIVALLAIFIPARRATRVDPMEALRYE